MASIVDIYNLAISHVGTGSEISSTTEKTEEARACNRFYDLARKQVLVDHDWNFATKEATLNLISTNTEGDWGYTYQKPSDCLKVRYLLPEKSRYPFREIDTKIETDIYDAEIAYTENLTNSELFSPNMTMALSYRLAAYITPRLTSGDPFQIKRGLLDMYDAELRKAKVQALQEGQKEKDPDSEMITIREG